VQPSSQPSSHPTRSPVTSKPTKISNPTSTPTLNLQNWESDELYYKFLNYTQSVKSLYGHIPFSTYIYKNTKTNIAGNTGCNDWNKFIKNQLSLPFDYISFFKLSAYAETSDMFNNRIFNGTIVCDDSVSVKQIIDILQNTTSPTKQRQQQQQNITCNRNVWSIKYCSTGYAICVNCNSNSDLCSSTYCPSLNNYLYTSPCSSCPNAAKSTKGISQYTLLDFQYKELLLYPLIAGNIDITTYKNSFKLALNISKSGNVYCAAVDKRNDIITSTIDIQKNGVKYVNTNIGYSIIQVEIKSLFPSSIYNIYCYTEDLLGRRMPFSAVAKTTAQTLCCASISFTSFFSSISETTNTTTASSNKIFTFALDSPPKINSVIRVIAVPILKDCSYYENGTVLVPSKYIVPEKFQFSNQSTSLSGSFLIKAMPGCYKIVAYVSEGGPYDNATDSTNVLSSKTPPDPPLFTSAQFSNDGRYIYVNFDSSTDKAAVILSGKVNFDCR